MSNYCTLKDINKAAGAFNLALPDDLIRARRESQGYIDSIFSADYDLTRFSSSVPIIRELTCKYASYLIKKAMLLNTGVSAEDIETDEESRTMLAIWKKTVENLRKGDITIEVTETGKTFNSDDYIRLAYKRPRDIKVYSGTTEYYKNEDYGVDYDARVIFRLDDDMADTVDVRYNSSLRNV